MEAQNQAFVKEIQVQETVVPNLKLTLELTRQAYKAGDQVVADFEAIQLNNSPLANAALHFSVLVNGQPAVNGNAKTSSEGKYQISFELPAVPKGDQPVLSVMVENGGIGESITKSIPMVDSDLLVAFFPEGGDFLLNTHSRLAIKVMKPDSTSADAEGWLVNQNSDKIQYIKTLHRGLGLIEFTPKAGESYKIEWKSPLETASPLPEALDKGFALAARSIGDSAVELKVHTPIAESMILVAQMRGKWLWDKAISPNIGENTIRVPVSAWPAGVVQFTLFDSREIARCERLVFVNSDKRLKIKIKSDKEQYQTREKVTLTVRATDERDIPVPAAITLAVANDALLSYAGDKQGNLLSSMLLEQDLNTKLEDPTFYFGTDVKAKPALDLVMMTYGWRGFAWKKMLSGAIEMPGIKPEKAFLAGKIVNQSTNQPLGGAKLTIGKTTTSTDGEGRFRFPFVDLSEAYILKIEKEGLPTREQPIPAYGDNLQLYYMPYELEVMPMAMADMAMGGNMEKAEVPKNVRIRKRDKVDPVAKVAVPAPEQNVLAAEEKKAEERQDVKVKRAPLRPRPPRGEGAPMQPPLPNVPTYYRARVYPNLPPAKTNQRSDFRSTLFWSGIVDLDANGRGSFSFYTADEITSYRATAQGIGPDGLLGVAHDVFYTELPFSISAKLPVELNVGDVVKIPVLVSNKSDRSQTVRLQTDFGKALKVNTNAPESVLLAAQQTKEILVAATAVSSADSCKIHLALKTGNSEDDWTKTIRIVPRGYPVSLSFSGREMDKTFHFSVKNMIPGSIKVHATAFPDITSDLLAGVESILSEPYGCFEQTSMTSYPNVLVLNYLRNTSKPDQALVSRAEVLLEKGYKRLTTFETKQKGYEWFGGTPAHEALTAYGLVQFKEMQKIAPYVDKEMIDRTASWLMGRRDGKGGFLKSPQALDNFGRASDDVTNAYIVYSLAEAGSQQIDIEVNKVVETALQKKDPYLLALACNTLWLLKKSEKAAEVTKVLIAAQKDDGSWQGHTHSITYSQGEALTIETTSFALLALLRSDAPDKPRIDKAVQYLCAHRQGKGGFGNTQATIVALKALTQYVVFSKRAAEDGGFTLTANGKDAASAHWKAGTQKAISETNWQAHIKEGDNKLDFRYTILKDPLPFTIGVDYFTSLPPSDATSKLSLTTSLSTSKTLANKPVQMKVRLKNESKEGRPMTMAVVCIPGGCVVSPVQFKELMASKKVDFYETNGNKIYLYYRQLAPEEEKNIVLTLTPVVKGNYQASASSAYLYYTAEKKEWARGVGLTIE